MEEIGKEWIGVEMKGEERKGVVLSFETNYIK
jgi:hypothetical protein